MHNKFTIIDDEWVQSGSWNYTNAASDEDNFFDIEHSPSRAQAFTADWERLQVLGQEMGRDAHDLHRCLYTTLNVNADTFAGAVAGALKAKRLLLLTDVPGVLDKSKKLIPELSIKDARKLIADGTISGGMIPKVETCIYALEQGVQGVVIIDGKMQHAVLLELFTNQGTGTLIHK